MPTSPRRVDRRLIQVNIPFGNAGLLRAALIAGASVCTLHLQAQPYPARPLRMVVPFVAGGSTDIFARMVSQHLNEAWKQAVVIDNRAGAAGNIGTELVARATGDGYTLLMASPGFVINPSLHKRAGFDPLKDFAAVAYVSLTPLVVTVHPSVPAKTLAELVELARRQPGILNFASAGSSTHLGLHRMLRIYFVISYFRAFVIL